MEVATSQQVSKLYSNKQGLKSATFKIMEGEFVGIVGQSGAGKTTLMRLLCGAVFPTGGELSVFGTDMRTVNISGLRKLRERIGTVYQNNNVVPCLDVCRNVMLGCIASASWYETIRRLLFPSQTEISEIQGILAQLNIGEKMYERCQELSGGQQQRVAIARALYSKADLFLADEPIASVDPTTANLILNTFSLLKKQGKTIIMNLHQLDQAMKYCDRILMLEEGRVIFDGEPRDFINTREYYLLARNDQQEGGPLLDD